MPRTMRFLAALLGTALFLLAGQAFCQNDPPDRVARLSYISGDVSMQPGGVNDWVDAQLNRPLTSGDRLWTARDARAELELGTAALRLDGETSFTLSTLDDRTAQIQIADGTLNVRLRKIYEDETFEVDTPNFTVKLLRSGDYRIDVSNEGDYSKIAVWSGDAQVNGAGQSVEVQPRQQARFSGGDQGTYEISPTPAMGAFDEWCLNRDRRYDEAKSARYVPREVIGYQDLDDYGNWRTYGAYGPIWIPSAVPVGWAPYRYGHWEWIYPWGWTWIDNAPWGFAPFHYGRWVYSSWGWGWVPCSRYMRPVYAPALVAWVGGANWGVGFSIGGGVGWFPLGPREPFIPWYRASRGYFSRVNIRNTYFTTTYITNIYDRHYRMGGDRRYINDINYVNRHAPHGITAMDRNDFIHSRPVHDGILRGQDFRNARTFAGPPADPVRASLLGGRSAAIHRPPTRAFSHPVMNADRGQRPMSFERQTAAFYGRDNNPGNNGNRGSGIRTDRPNDRGRGDFADRGQRGRGEPQFAGQPVPRPPSRDAVDRGGYANRQNNPGMQASRGRSDSAVPRPPDNRRGMGQPSGVDRTSVPRPAESNRNFENRAVRDSGGFSRNTRSMDMNRGPEMRSPRAEQPGRASRVERSAPQRSERPAARSAGRERGSAPSRSSEPRGNSRSSGGERQGGHRSR